jgi:hypothetical protein
VLAMAETMAVRDSEFFLYPSDSNALCSVGMNRGASGIDGIMISSATGYSEAKHTRGLTLSLFHKRILFRIVLYKLCCWLVEAYSRWRPILAITNSFFAQVVITSTLAASLSLATLLTTAALATIYFL